MQKNAPLPEALLRLMADATQFGFYVVDNRTDAILYYNTRFLELWNLTALEPQLRRGELGNRDLMPHFLSLLANSAAFAENSKPLQDETDCAAIEDDIPFADGRTLRRVSMQIRDSPETSSGRFSLFEDITQRKRTELQIETYLLEMRELNVRLEWQAIEVAEANARLNALATTDGLTNLKNHRAFREALKQEFARSERYQTPLSIALLDIDYFKQYNDAYGHPEGDTVLIAVGRILRQTLRETDLTARYGGEEFVLMLPETDADGARALVERCRAAIEAYPWSLRAITVSVGVATRSPAHSNDSALIESADKALYHAKRSGRNQIADPTEISL